MRSPYPGGRPSAGAGKTPMPRRSTFFIGPGSHSTASDSSTPRAAITTTGRSIEDEAAGNPQREQPTAADGDDEEGEMENQTTPKAQSPRQHVLSHPSNHPRGGSPRVPSTAGKSDEEHLDIKERLRRQIMAEDNQNTVCSSSDYDDDDEANTKVQLAQQRRQAAYGPPPRPYRAESPQQIPSTASKQDEEPLDIKERLRRQMMADDNQDAICSSSDDDEADAKVRLAQQRRQAVYGPPPRPYRAENPQQATAASRGGEKQEQLDLKEQLRRAITSEDNAQAVGSDDEESETDDQGSPKARSPPPSLQRHQKQRAPAGPSSKSKAGKQPLYTISAKEGNAPSPIQEEDGDEDKAAARTIPTAPSFSGRESKPSSLLTQSLMAQRAAAAGNINKAPAWLPTHHHLPHEQSQFPLTVSMHFQAKDAAKRGLPEVLTTVVHDVPALLKAQKQETQKSLQEMARYTKMGRRTGLPLRRIEEEDDKKKEAYDKKKQEDTKKKQADAQKDDQKGKAARAAETDFTAAAAAIAGGGAADSHPRPPPRAYCIGSHVSDHRKDYLRSQPMPKYGWHPQW
ncbi:hypothetical protein PG994_010323 [Apiospora phragmitis]|uniref:Uncharacterized protein n=1 Tax=Apiospora phragmitis TaxID=2905665 RepID=A0ABR1TPS8_9PEZI